MIALLASLAWADDPIPDERDGGNDGARIAFATLSGAAAGGMGGLILGTILGGVANRNLDCDTTIGECPGHSGGLVFVGAGVGLLVGGITGGIAGGVIKSNQLKRERVTVVPVGPDGPGLTVVGTF